MTDIPAPPPALRLVALGASDVVGVGAARPDAEAWPPVLAAMLPGPKKLMRLGISGATAGRIRAELLPRAIAARPDVAVVWAGVNDCAQQVPLPRYQADLDAIVGGLAKAGARVFVLNLPDLAQLPLVRPYVAWIHGVLPAWQGAVRQVAAKHGAHVVELAPYSAELARNPGLLSPDGFHPSAAGYRRIAEIVADAVRPLAKRA